MRDADKGGKRDAWPERVEAVMEGARSSGLLAEKDARVAGRLSSQLLERAKARTGIRSTSDLVAFALANVALDDGFGEAFRRSAGSVDPGIDLEF